MSKVDSAERDEHEKGKLLFFQNLIIHKIIIQDIRAYNLKMKPVKHRI